MESKNSAKLNVRKSQVLMRIIICVIVLFIGFFVMMQLSNLKKAPAEEKIEEQAIQVEGIIAKTEDIRVSMTGYGEARTLNSVSISPEISGRVVYIHPLLELGEIIPRNDTLFEIDSQSYAATLKEANASLQQLNASLLSLKKQFAIDLKRQQTIERNRDLAKSEFDRVKQLFKEKNVGTLSGVDQAEKSYNAAVDQADQMSQALALYPIQIQEAKAGIEAAKARVTQAEINLQRCKATSPFKGRVKAVSLEIGQYVSPGQPVVTLADDSLLEIQISLNSREARNWLVFDNSKTDNSAAWFSKLEPVLCRIRWTETPAGHEWQGKLTKVVKFSQQTRTLTVAVQVDAQAALPNDTDGFPLTEGMFCSVEIPGKILRNVIRLPRWAVSFENTTYLATSENRLKTTNVTIAHTDGDNVFVSEGVAPGDTVLVTRLSDPLENALLNVTIK